MARHEHITSSKRHRKNAPLCEGVSSRESYRKAGNVIYRDGSNHRDREISACALSSPSSLEVTQRLTGAARSRDVIWREGK